MDIIKNKSLRSYNTFGVDCISSFFTTINNLKDLDELYQHKLYKSQKKLILGGGSNILFTSNFDGLVIKNEIKGIEIIKETNDIVEVQIGAGVNWHEFVIHAVNNKWGGIENMSLIPGNCGTAPMQNIGAYGVEIKDTFVSLNAYEIETGKIVSFDRKRCEFGYRDSVFKNDLKDQYIILDIRLRLQKKPTLNTKYGDINNTLIKNKVSNPTIKDISDAVIEIRTSKLPDPKKIGNAGSFFKNPIISQGQFKEIKMKFPEIVSYPVNEQKVKLAAGWLIEKAGWKGKNFGNYGVHKKQSLVLVNYNSANGREIFNLSQEILEDVFNKFQVKLEREVNIL
ncbi:MAG: UDP-N-acetylmuramate dehydrogenase [Bacteroidota bacterium]|nr:UDP-N-acetylmuramate dehydrogenase [Bacteroidota bacterium]